MVSYYNPLPYSQKHSAANLAYPAGQPWQWPTNYHTPPNHQFLGEMDSPHAHHQMYYNPMFHSAAASAASEWHSPTSSAENFSSTQNIPSAHQMLQHQHQSHGIGVGGVGGGVGGGGAGGGGSTGTSSNVSSGSSSASAGPGSGHTPLNDTVSSIGEHHIAAEGLPSPPITVSGSEISSPGAPASSASPHHGAHHLHNANANNNNNNSPTSANNNGSSHNNNNNNNNTINHNNNNNRQSSPVKSPYYDWMKKPTYPAQPTPGKTRTKDKYRVVYTDFQRLELEKEYCTSRYITIRRKTELAQTLSLSERQVKIWFQNRRAKERKQSKKGSDSGSLSIQQQHNEYVNLMDTKPKLEPGLHLQHSLHSMSSMAAMSMPGAIGLHHHHHHLHGHHHHHALAAHTAAAAHHQSLHQSPHAQMSAAAVAAAASVGTLSM